jgi:transglutaminase-like putative cysteine protease
VTALLRIRRDQEATSVAEVMASKRGVCQDFAHFTIACLRSLGLAARYVSRYLRSGELIGSQASHGRDYTDVAPVSGVTLGGGEQVINVSVTVAPAGG